MKIIYAHPILCVCVPSKCGEGESAWDPTQSDLLWGNRDQSFQRADFNLHPKLFLDKVSFVGKKSGALPSNFC